MVSNSEIFEIFHRDAMGRIGKIETPHGVVETPTLMPVINPNIDFIPASKMRKFGVQILITNSYIIKRSPSLHQVAVEKGLHSLLDVDIPIMTDSGSYQLMVYGDVEVSNMDIVKFQEKIGSDIIVPLDIPTSPDVSYENAEKDLKITLKRESEARSLIKGKNLLAIPIQGSTHSELRKRSAGEAVEIGGDIYPIGGIVPLLDEYRLSDVIKIVKDVKSVLPASAPVHLFGAGHPIFFSIAVALGCDLFDSAAYALYAKDDRYMTSYGTKKIRDLHYLPCSCPICSDYTVKELQNVDRKEREILIGEHNLWVCFEEIKKIKQAIRERSLFEFVEKRIRGHPNLITAWRQTRDFTALEEHDPSMKQIFFYTGVESIYRPAVKRHHVRVKNIELEKEEYTISTNQLKEGIDFILKPVFGVVPVEMKEVYPAGHAELPPPNIIESEAIETGVHGLNEFLIHNSDKSFKIEADEVWRNYLKNLPPNAELI